ncbi:MAG: beta-N-acetylglucosaminidase domain-containing protein, partial [Kaistella sp.]|nr:beta-N-acetylglucosaminidase domain-containing protein [Kaistella sp.]
VEGYITNPMNQWVSSRVGIASCAYYAWNPEGYNPEVTYNEILENEFKNLLPNILVFFDANRATVVDHYRNNEFKYMVEKEDYETILDFYNELENAVNNLLDADLRNNPLIIEITPWLKWSLTEISLVRKLIKGEVSKEELVEQLEDKHRLGVEVLDYLIKKQPFMC